MDDKLFIKDQAALVVIDLQKGITSMECEPYSCSDVISNASKMAKGFRGNNMPVFLVHVGPMADGKDRLTPPSDHPHPVINRTPDWMDFVSELGQEASDIVITKRQWGAFYGTELDLQLRRRGIKTIVLCGISTSAGVESTARFAYEYGYNQVLVEDACSARSEEEHDNSFKYIFPKFANVRKTSDVLTALSQS